MKSGPSQEQTRLEIIALPQSTTTDNRYKENIQGGCKLLLDWYRTLSLFNPIQTKFIVTNIKNLGTPTCTSGPTLRSNSYCICKDIIK